MFWDTEKNPKMTNMERKFLRMIATLRRHATIVVKKTGPKGVAMYNVDTQTEHHGDITRQGRIE